MGFTILNVADLTSKELRPYKKALRLLKKRICPKLIYGLIKISFSKEVKRHCLAIYDDDNDSIVLIVDYIRSEHENPFETLIHEVGHRLWYQFLTKKQKAEVYRLFRECKKKKIEKLLPTTYSKTNTIEFFAENFAACVRRKSIPKAFEHIIFF